MKPISPQSEPTSLDKERLLRKTLTEELERQIREIEGKVPETADSLLEQYCYLKNQIKMLEKVMEPLRERIMDRLKDKNTITTANHVAILQMVKRTDLDRKLLEAELGAGLLKFLKESQYPKLTVQEIVRNGGVK